LFYAEKRKSRLVSGSFQMKKWRFHQVSGFFYSEKWKSHPVSCFSPQFEEKTGAFVITFKKRNGSEGISEGLNEGISEGINEGLNEGLKEQEKIHFKGGKRNGGYYAL